MVSNQLSLNKDLIEDLIKNPICKVCDNLDEFHISIQESTKYRIYGLKFNELKELEREVEMDETYQSIKVTCGKCGNIITEEMERFL